MGSLVSHHRSWKETRLAHLSEVIEDVFHDHHQLLEARDHLRKAADAPQEGREIEWAVWVWNSLEESKRAIFKHELDVTGPTGLYEELEFEHPRLGHALETMIQELGQIDELLELLQKEVREVRSGDFRRIGFIRGHVEDMLGRIDSIMRKEGDLIHEALNEPLAID